MTEVWDYETGVIDYLNQIDALEESPEKQELVKELADKLVGEFTHKNDFIIVRGLGKTPVFQKLLFFNRR